MPLPEPVIIGNATLYCGDCRWNPWPKTTPALRATPPWKGGEPFTATLPLLG